MLMTLSYGWGVQKLSKYQVGIKWILNEKLIWTPNSIYDVSWRVLKSSGPNKFVEILEVLGVDELMSAQLICNIVVHMQLAVWLILLLVVSDLSTFVCSVKHQVSKEWVSVNTPCTLSNNNPGFSLWGITINSLTRIDEDISDIFWPAGVFLCLDQLLLDSRHCSGSLELK